MAEIWFEQNHRIFHNNEMHWLDCFETANRDTAAWCTLQKILKLNPSKKLVLIGEPSIFRTIFLKEKSLFINILITRQKLIVQENYTMTM